MADLSDDDLKAVATRLFPDWREDIQDRFVTQLSRAAIAADRAINAPVQAEPVAWTVAGSVTNWARDFSKYRTQHYVRPVFFHPAPVAPAEPRCIECSALVQWRCPACQINNFGPVAPAEREQWRQALTDALEVGGHLMSAGAYERARALRDAAPVAQVEPTKCPTCGGNDADIPCAYPSKGMPGCPRDARLYGAAPQVERAGWVPMHERAPEPDTVCAVMLRYTLDRPPFIATDRWEMQREDPTGMGGPTMEMGYAWRDNYEGDVIAWFVLPPMPPAEWDQRLPASPEPAEQLTKE